MSRVKSENELEHELLNQLVSLGYKRVNITNEEELIDNLKIQIEYFNKDVLSNQKLSQFEFDKILTHLSGDDLIGKSKKLRSRFQLELDSGEKVYIRFFNNEKWCQNNYQVTNQITIKGKYENRYDTTILINGFPLCQIEEKKNGIAIKEAFNQTIRYKKHSYSFNSKFFDYIQVFVITNETNTKYYTNNKKLRFEDTFFWTDKENKKLSSLKDFTNSFLETCQLSKMISQYIVISETQDKLFILKPYQCYATEAIVDRVENTNLHGYIWHTTGSGKTLTSFKTSQILQNIENVKKVLFVVDRKDLDYQTIREFNHFSEGSVDGTNNTKSLIEQLTNKNVKLIVTTIQKLNIVVKHLKRLFSNKEDINQFKKYRLNKEDIVYLKTLVDSKIVCIFDECHRSQFGDSHTNISNFFSKIQMFGFTGTPIMEENANGGKTTLDLFTKRLHTYTVKDAVADGNVLPFTIKYFNTFKGNKEKIEKNTEKAQKINVEEIYYNSKRLNIIVEDIINRHSIETNNKKYNGIFAVSNIETAIKYYKLFKTKNTNLKVSTIFTFNANEEDREDGNLEETNNFFDENIKKHTRDELEDIIRDYNDTYKTNFSTNTFDNYYQDISKKLKSKEIDILIVVNMFLTGFDSKYISVLYTDKNLKYHGLQQAFSRTNRTESSNKPFGNIVCYRDLRENVDIALSLFGDKEAKEIVIQPTFEELKNEFKKEITQLKGFISNPENIDNLESEQEKKKFVTGFRNILICHKKISYFPDFSLDTFDYGLTSNEFASYTSKYLDIYDNVHNQNEVVKTSILSEINFEIDLLREDTINVDYILHLLTKNKTNKKKKKSVEDIFKILENNPELRPKKELIKEFLEKNLIGMTENETSNNFFDFINEKKLKEIKDFCDKEKLNIEEFKSELKNYSKNPRIDFFEGDNVLNIKKLSINPISLMKRKSFTEIVIFKIKELYLKFF